jgi:hypothetical protein
MIVSIHIYIMNQDNMKKETTTMLTSYEMVYTMFENAYLPLLTSWLNARSSQITSETILTISHNTCLCASS